MPVALENLRRGRGGLETEALAGDALELGVGRRVGADGSRELPHPHPLQGPREPLPVAVELESPAGELQAERRWLGMNAVGPAHLEGHAVLFGAGNDGGERAVDPLEEERAG